MSENAFVVIGAAVWSVLLVLSLIATFKDAPFRTERRDAIIRGAGVAFLAGTFLTLLCSFIDIVSPPLGLILLPSFFLLPGIVIWQINRREAKKRRALIEEKCATFEIPVPAGDLLAAEKYVDQQEIEYKKREAEREYLAWCEPQTDEERVLQHIVDRLLEIHQWDDMPRIKAVVADCGAEARGRYNGGFNGFRKPFYQFIEVDKEHFLKSPHRSVVATIKHELVHGWMDWKGIKMPDSHGPQFQTKLQEVS